MTDEPRARRKTRSQVVTGGTYRMPPPPWTRNWIDHRSSRANVHRRLDRGQVAPTCGECGCELDLEPAPHSPRCEA